MTFTLKRDSEPGESLDFSVLYNGEKIGRIYETPGSRSQWVWTLDNWGSTKADTLNNAKARLKWQWAMMQNIPPP